MAAREHGTRAKYVVERCRCTDCRAANTDYANHVTRQRAYEPFVDAFPSRVHIQWLQANGVGLRTIHQRSGIARSSLTRIATGRVDHVRPDTAAKIAALAEQANPVAGGVLTDSTGTRRRMQALMVVGWSLSVQARHIGWGPANYIGLLSKDLVRVSTKTAVAQLYDDLWKQCPPTKTAGQRASAARTRAAAAARGFVGPLCWDDDTIDNPATQPDGFWHAAS